MTDARLPQPPGRLPRRRPTSPAAGLKALIAAASLTAVVGGWAIIAARSGAAGAAQIPLAAEAARTGVGAGPPAGLRQVTAPSPLAITRSSR